MKNIKITAPATVAKSTMKLTREMLECNLGNPYASDCRKAKDGMQFIAAVKSAFKADAEIDNRLNRDLFRIYVANSRALSPA